MNVASNYYTLLGIPIDATPEEIRNAYREKARRIHPDANPEPEASEKFIQLQKAYETLSDPDQRVAYNNGLPAQFTLPPVMVSTLFSRGTLQRLNEPQILYVLLKFTPQSYEIFNTSIPLNICLVVDCSTSMKGILMDTVKSTAIELIHQLRPNDIISIIAFSDRAEVIVPAGMRQDRASAETNIRMLSTSGGTEIYQGLEAGYREVQRYRSSKYSNHIILITDGRTYGDEPLCEKLAEASATQKIGISGLGIGSQWNDAFLDRLASKTGGETLFVSQPADVEKFLKQKVSRLGMSFAENISYEFTFQEGVELRYAFRFQPEASILETSSPIQIGSIPQNASLEVILDFLIHPIATIGEQVHLTNGRIYYDVPAREDPHCSLRLDLTRAASNSTDPLAPPQAIVQAMSSLTLYRIQERARQDVLEGKYKEATRRLQNLATHLLSQGQRELAQTVLGEAIHIQQNASYSDDGDKRIKYGTRALLLPSDIEENVL